METTQNIAVTSKKLKQLCNKYHYELCRGLKPDYLPKIRIRYVEERGKFGYADFGDFFFFDDDLFVWRSEDKFAGDHSQDVVDGEFNEMCSRLEYACRFLYAGIDTNFTDCNGEHIFVGDVLEITDNSGYKSQLALSHMPFKENDVYCFVLDNHFLALEKCLKEGLTIMRIGTSFFQLDWNFSTEDMDIKIRDFNGWCDSNEEHEEKVFMAKYTPNFDQETWKYYGLEIFGVEYNWK